MKHDIWEYLQREVYERCRKETNCFGIGCYYHIAAVVKNAALLAEPYGADRETVMAAAWLHDIASVTDPRLYELHHIHGAEMARDILIRCGFDRRKIPLVQTCIRSHRGSVLVEKCSPEERCVADADAISHLDNLPSLFYLAYVQKGMGIDEGRDFVAGKLTRSFQKLSEAGKACCRERYESAMALLRGLPCPAGTDASPL